MTDGQAVKARVDIEEISRSLYGITFNERGQGRCPFHQRHNNGDANPSFHLDRNHQRVRCQSQDCFGGAVDVIEFVMKMEGLDFKEACEKLMKCAGLSDRPSKPAKDQGRKVVAIYDYRDEQGELRFQTIRYEPGRDGRSKDFGVRRPDGKGGWISNVTGVRLVPYRLPDLLKANGPTVVVEGEKCADALWDLGIAATCNPFGAGKWKDEYSALLKDREIILWPDKDEVGLRHAEAVGRSLQGAAASIRFLEPPVDLPDRGDVADGVQDLGWGIEKVQSLLDQAQPWKPTVISPPEREAQESREPSQVAVVTPPKAKPEIFPLELPDSVWRGVVTDYRDMLVRTTEASDAYHFFTFLTCAGSLIGRQAFLRYGLHLYGNLYLCIVGPTYEGRKSTSTRHAERTLKEVVPSWRLLHGISSAEGLLSQIADPWEKKDRKGVVIGEGGTSDKRLLVSVGEFSSLLRKAKQDSVSNIIPLLTEAFDCPTELHLPTRHDPIVVSGPYISLIATSTPSWLEDLQDRDVLGGFANRFLYVLGEAKDPMPFPDPPNAHLQKEIITHLTELLTWLPNPFEVSLDESAKTLWADFYTRWRNLVWGDELLAALVQRIPDITMKIALLYAVLEKRQKIDKEMLEAAIDAGGYAVASAQRIFTDFHATRESKLEKRILAVLNPEGVTFGDLHRAVGGRYSTVDLNRTMDALVKSGQAWRQEEEGRVVCGRIDEK